METENTVSTLELYMWVFLKEESDADGSLWNLLADKIIWNRRMTTTVSEKYGIPVTSEYTVYSLS